jgi:uncharacterized protein
MVASCTFQEKLIFPGSSSQGSRDAKVMPTRSGKLIEVTLTDGTRCKALFAPAWTTDWSHGASPPTVIFFYGNADRLANQQGLHDWFTRNGCNALFPEYPGYGISEGSPSAQAFFDLADKIAEFVKSDEAKLLGIDPGHIIVAGQSLGSGSASYFASKYPTRKMVLLSPFTSVANVAQRKMWYMPVKWLVRHRFDNEARWPGITAPTLIVSGTRDEIVPHDMSVRLQQLAPDRVKLIKVEGAGHNDLFDHQDVFMPRLRAFIGEK